MSGTLIAGLGFRKLAGGEEETLDLLVQVAVARLKQRVGGDIVVWVKVVVPKRESKSEQKFGCCLQAGRWPYVPE